MSSIHLSIRHSIVPIASTLISTTLFLDSNRSEQYGYGVKCWCDPSVPPSTPISISKDPNTMMNVTADPKPPISVQIQADDAEVIRDQNKLLSHELSTNKIGTSKVTDRNDDNDSGEKIFHDLFPLRQLWVPKVDYPLWDKNWDGRAMKSLGNAEADRSRERLVRKNGITRHIILVRHGQYDETHKEDEKRTLTPLGIKQAKLTGKRIAEMISGFDDEKFGPCNVTTIHVSNMARAKETADIIAKQLPSYVNRADPNANLNEGRPCHTIPGAKASPKLIKITEESHEKIEKAFQTYFYRSEYREDVAADTKIDNGESTTPSLAHGKQTEEIVAEKGRGHPKHEFEIIVCHANVIRYFFCRALQIPPEAWLRLATFNCSLTYLTIRPNGNVSCRMLGDIGHLGYDHSTFSMHHGFNW